MVRWDLVFQVDPALHQCHLTLVGPGSRETIAPITSWRSCSTITSRLSISAIPSWQSRDARCCSGRAGVSCFCCDVHGSEAGEGYKELDCEGKHLLWQLYFLRKWFNRGTVPCQCVASLYILPSCCLSVHFNSSADVTQQHSSQGFLLTRSCCFSRIVLL